MGVSWHSLYGVSMLSWFYIDTIFTFKTKFCDWLCTCLQKLVYKAEYTRKFPLSLIINCSREAWRCDSFSPAKYSDHYQMKFSMIKFKNDNCNYCYMVIQCPLQFGTFITACLFSNSWKCQFFSLYMSICPRCGGKFARLEYFCKIFLITNYTTFNNMFIIT